MLELSFLVSCVRSGMGRVCSCSGLDLNRVDFVSGVGSCHFVSS